MRLSESNSVKNKTLNITSYFDCISLPWSFFNIVLFLLCRQAWSKFLADTCFPFRTDVICQGFYKLNCSSSYYLYVKRKYFCLYLFVTQTPDGKIKFSFYSSWVTLEFIFYQDLSMWFLQDSIELDMTESFLMKLFALPVKANYISL